MNDAPPDALALLLHELRCAKEGRRQGEQLPAAIEAVSPVIRFLLTVPEVRGDRRLALSRCGGSGSRVDYSTI